MILLDMEIPKSCYDCRFRADTGRCELTGFYTSHKAYVMPLSYDCPIKAEIPDNATNGDVIKAMFPDVVNSDMDLVDAFNNAKRWWNAQWKGQKNAD